MKPPGAGPKPAMRPRQMGGFNPGMGMGNEHLDESAMKQAVGQKQLQQQQSSTQAGSGKSGTNPLLQHAGDKQGGEDALSQLAGQQQKGTFQPDKPRPVGDLKTELINRPAEDIKKGLASLFDINALLDIKPGDTPEEQAKKQQLHQRWQKLNEEQQEVARRKYQEDMQKKKAEQEEEEQRKQAEAEKNDQALAAPSSPKKGPIGPSGSRKQKAQTQLQQSRQGIGKVGNKH